jgi:hypothetical protein
MPSNIIRMVHAYGYSAQNAVAAPAKMRPILEALSARLHKQQRVGSRYFVGKQLTALDLYWANMSEIIEPCPPEKNPMPDFFRQINSRFVPPSNRLLILCSWHIGILFLHSISHFLSALHNRRDPIDPLHTFPIGNFRSHALRKDDHALSPSLTIAFQLLYRGTIL